MAFSCQKKEPTAVASTGEAKEVVKPEKITVLGTVIVLAGDNGGVEWRTAYEKMTGIKLETIKPAHNQYTERVNLAFASGDLHDMTDLYYAFPIIEGADLYVADTIKIRDRLYAVPSTHGKGCVTYKNNYPAADMNKNPAGYIAVIMNKLKSFTEEVSGCPG